MTAPRAVLAGLMAAGLVAAYGCTAAPPTSTLPVQISAGRTAGVYKGSELDPGRGQALPAVTLTDTSGLPYALRDGSTAAPATQPVTVLFFGYSNCPDVCTGILADMASAVNRLDPAVRSEVRVVFVTTDPARDTPAVVKDYLARIDPSFVGLTGDLATIVAAGYSVGVPIEEGTKLPSGGYEVAHGTQIIGFDKSKTATVVWPTPTPIGDLRADLETLVARQK